MLSSVESALKTLVSTIGGNAGFVQSNARMVKLTSHLESKHLQTLTEDVKKLTGDRKGPTNSHLRNLSQDAKDYHDWIEWLVISDLPFTFVESRYTRKNSRVNAISRPTLMQYMNEVTYLYLI